MRKGFRKGLVVSEEERGFQKRTTRSFKIEGVFQKGLRVSVESIAGFREGQRMFKMREGFRKD